MRWSSSLNRYGVVSQNKEKEKESKKMLIIQLNLTHLSQDGFPLICFLIVLVEFLGFMIESIIYELLRHRKEMQALKNEEIQLLLQSGKRKRKRKKGEKNTASSLSLFASVDDMLQEPEDAPQT
jgi:hypothetical protein